MCFWRCAQSILREYGSHEEDEDINVLKNEVIQWAQEHLQQLADMMDMPVEPLQQQLTRDAENGRMASDKSVAAFAAYLGIRLVIIHEDTQQLWSYVGAEGKPTGTAWTLYLQHNHFTCGSELDTADFLAHGAGSQVGIGALDPQFLAGRDYRPRAGIAQRAQPWQLLSVNCNHWKTAEQQIEAASEHQRLTFVAVQEHRLRELQCEDKKHALLLQGWNAFFTPARCTGKHANSTSGGTALLVRTHIAATRVEGPQGILAHRATTAMVNIGRSRPLLLTSLYSPTAPSPEEKLLIAESLITWAQQCIHPYIIVGDYNMTPPELRQLGVPQHMPAHIGATGNFTYTNGEDRSELDYALYSAEVLTRRPRVSLYEHNLVRPHTAILVEFTKARHDAQVMITNPLPCLASSPPPRPFPNIESVMDARLPQAVAEVNSTESLTDAYEWWAAAAEEMMIQVYGLQDSEVKRGRGAPARQKQVTLAWLEERRATAKFGSTLKACKELLAHLSLQRWGD
eukprot:6460988-Amphidinium_carterae.1